MYLAFEMSTDSGIQDYSIDSAESTSKKNEKKYLTLPARLMLDEMLMQLGLLAALYESKVYEDGKTCVTVHFHTSKILFRGALVPTSISGIRTMDVAVAEHTAAEAAIRYLETAANTVIKDLNYNRVKNLEAENRALKTEIKEAKLKAKGFARGWYLSVRHMRSFAAQFHNLAILNYFAGKEVIHDDIKAAFSNIDGNARRLKIVGSNLEKILGRMRRRS